MPTRVVLPLYRQIRRDYPWIQKAFEVTVQRLDSDDRVFVARFLLD